MKRIIAVFLLTFTSFALSAQQLPRLLIAPFETASGITADEANVLTEVFNNNLHRTGRVELINRSVMDEAIRELHFQLNDWSDNAKTAERKPDGRNHACRNKRCGKLLSATPR